jgi:hypothetical protein
MEKTKSALSFLEGRIFLRGENVFIFGLDVRKSTEESVS